VVSRICLLLLMALAAVMPLQAQTSTDHAEAIAALTQRYVEQPQSHYLAYMLARFSAEDGLDEAALQWLTLLHKRGWDLGVNPRDFPGLQNREEFRALKLKLQRQQQRRERGQRALLVNVAGLVPEGLAYDAKRDRFLVGAMNAPRIHAVDRHGRVSLLWSTDAPVVVLGMSVAGDGETLLAVVNPTPQARAAGTLRPFVARIALADGHEISRLPADDAAFLNDLCQMRDGRVFVSDSEQSRLFRAGPADTALSLWSEPGHAIAANGMACDDAHDAVYVAVYNGISRIDAASGQAQLLAGPNGAATGGIDGLYLADRYLVGVQNGFGAGRVLRARLSADGREIHRVETLESAIVDLNEPTTGTLTPDGFVYIANSQIWKWDADKQSLRPDTRLSPIMLRRVPLR